MTRARAYAYAIAALASLAAILLWLWLGRTLAPGPFTLFLAALVLSAWAGGKGPALLVVVVGAVSSIVLYFPRAASLHLSNLDMGVQLAVYLLVALFIIWIEDQRRRQAEQRATLERQKDEFLSAAAHDLQNPLTNIKIQAQMLARNTGRLPAEQATEMSNGLRRIDATVTRMSVLIDELLDLTRGAMGRPVALNRESIALADLVRHVVADQQETTEYHAIRVKTADASIVGEWDGRRLERVIGNLLSNAVKYSPEGSDVEVEISRRDHDGVPGAALVVSDHGMGIPAEDLPRVFDRFYRARNVSESISGTGVGLAAVKQIVEQHGGTVSAASGEDGTVLNVWLPLTEK